MLSLRNILHSEPEYDFIAPGDGFGHTFWVIDKEEDITAITKEFAKLCRLFILPMAIIARLLLPW